MIDEAIIDRHQRDRPIDSRAEQVPMHSQTNHQPESLPSDADDDVDSERGKQNQEAKLLGPCRHLIIDAAIDTHIIDHRSSMFKPQFGGSSL
jgi:hypothetical protein